MKSKISRLFTALTFMAALGTAIQSNAQKVKNQIVTFEVSPNLLTIPVSINPGGEITGNYFDTSL
jgi:hypothetical protein